MIKFSAMSGGEAVGRWREVLLGVAAEARAQQGEQRQVVGIYVVPIVLG